MIGKSLKEIKDTRNITSRMIASHMSCTEHTVNKWVSDVNNPTLEDLDKLADYFHVSVDYLMGRTESTEMYAENAKIRVNDDEVRFIMAMRELPASDRKEIESFIDIKTKLQQNKRG